MKLIISILLLSIVTFAQNTTYLDGTECICDSIRRDYLENGEVWSEYPYKNGKLNGLGKDYENGTLKGYKKCTDGRMGNEHLDCLN